MIDDVNRTNSQSPRNWSVIDAAFDRALDLADEAREEYLLSLGSDVRGAVRSLLETVSEPGPLDEGIDGLAGHLLQEAEAQLDPMVSGRRIGAYRILSRLGAGGMGVVYLAERADGVFDHQVALKIVRWELADEALVNRFMTERRILAQLSHPHIATLLDGGMTDEGLPYLVLERVDGLPVDEHCDAYQLPLTDRVELIETVCRAVDFAHRHFVVHRDLKPSNILVRVDGVPKLVDFGVAKLLEEAGADGTDLTQSHCAPLTPRYAAPEQRTRGPASVGSDVWALGVVLYELIAGVHPADGKPENEPPREPPPPSRASGNRELSGDLDNIVGTALRLEPERRYHTAGDLADDLKRWRNQLPVNATPSTWGYRLRKLVGRHRVAAAGIVVAHLVAALGLTGIFWQAHEARLERDAARAEAARAEQVTLFLEGLFESASPKLQGEPSVRDLLDEGAERIRAELAEMPGVQARLLGTLGSSFTGLGDFDRAEELFRHAIDIERELGEPRPEFISALTNLGGALHWSGRSAEAEVVFLDAIERLRNLDGADDTQVAGLLHSLGMARTAQGDPERAIAYFAEALSLYGDDQPDKIAMVRANAASALTRLGRLAEAEAEHRAALAAYRRHDPNSMAIATILNNLAINLDNQGKGDEAMAVVQECQRLRKNLPNDHPLLAATDSNVASFLIARGKPGAAVAMARSATNALKGSSPSTPAWIAARANLGWALAQVGELDEAEGWLSAVVEDCSAGFGADHRVTARARTLFGEALRRQGRVVQAEAVLEEAATVLREASAPDDQRAQAFVAWGATLCDTRRADEGLESVNEGAAIFAENPEHWHNSEAVIERARCLKALGSSWDEAAVLAAHQTLIDVRGADAWVVRRADTVVP
jgi:serine/threonine-protein kinase